MYFLISSPYYLNRSAANNRLTSLYFLWFHVTLFYFRDKFKLLAGSSCLQIYPPEVDSLQLFTWKHDQHDAVQLIQKQPHKLSFLLTTLFYEMLRATGHAKAIEKYRTFRTHNDIESNSLCLVDHTEEYN